MRILAFSDLHGNAATIELLRERVKNESFDYILVAGDLTNADLIPPAERVQQLKEIFAIMETFEIPYFYVWGLPFRESTLQFLQEEYSVIENEDRVTLAVKGGKFDNWMVEMHPKGWNHFKEMDEFLSTLKFGKHLRHGEIIKIGNYNVAATQENLPERTILLKHSYRKIVPNALLQLDGHLHFGQRYQNYLNLGFLYRDDAHNAQAMVGCYWVLELEGSAVSTTFVNLGGKLKEFSCPEHPNEGTFYIPFFWRKCPVCFEPTKSFKVDCKSLKLKQIN
jgi:predicted MPP superfamily phosphohydrolase